jgi:hypothetical protein
LRDAVKPGGTFIGAVFVRQENGGEHHNPAFELAPGELRGEFAGWKILYYSEARETAASRPAARIVARRA